MNRTLMVAGAFLIGLGVDFIAAIPTISTMTLQMGYTVSDLRGVVWLGVILLPFGAAILAYGVGTRDQQRP